MHPALRGSHSENDIIIKMVDACKPEVLSRSPYKYYGAERQTQACHLFREDWEEYLERAF